MARIKSTTPTNKKPLPAKPKGRRASSITEHQDDDTIEAESLQATIGESLLAKGVAPVNEVQVETFERRLPCPLTTDELVSKSRRASDIRNCIRRENKVIEGAKAEFDRVKKDSEAKCKQWEVEQESIDEAINANAEYRDVTCQRVFDHRLMTVTEIRLDTMAQLQAPRPMRAAEAEAGYTLDDGARKPADVNSVDDEDEDEDEDEG